MLNNLRFILEQSIFVLAVSFTTTLDDDQNNILLYNTFLFGAIIIIMFCSHIVPAIIL